MDKIRWYQSKTIWSDIVTILVGAYAVVQPVLATHGVNLPAVEGSVMATILAILGSFGIYARKVATTVIGK